MNMKHKVGGASQPMTRSQTIRSLFEGHSNNNHWYQGGVPQGGSHKNMFITQDKSYAEKYAHQHHNGVVRVFTLDPHAKIYPQSFWWEDYKNIWRPDQMFQHWDAVRVIEPSWHKEKDDESLVILNPAIVHQIG